MSLWWKREEQQILAGESDNPIGTQTTCIALQRMAGFPRPLTLDAVKGALGPTTEPPEIGQMQSGRKIGRDIFKWYFSDHSQLWIHVPAPHTVRFYQASRDAHLHILGPNGERLSSAGIVVPQSREPAHQRLL